MHETPCARNHSCQCDSPDATELAERDATFSSCGVEEPCCESSSCCGQDSSILRIHFPEYFTSQLSTHSWSPRSENPW